MKKKKKKRRGMWEVGRSTDGADYIHKAPVGSARRRVTPFNDLYEEALPEKGTFSGFWYSSAFYIWYVKEVPFTNERYMK